MKKLAIYSSHKSPHTHALIKFLSKTWDINLIGTFQRNTVSNDTFENSKHSNLPLEIISDLEHSQTPPDFFRKNKKVCFKDIIRYRKQGKKIISYRIKAESIRKTLEQLKPNLLSAHQMDCGIIAYLSGFRPYVITYWGSDIYRDLFDYKFKSLITKSINSAEKVQTVNEEMKNLLVKHLEIKPDKIFVQNFGAEIERFPPISNKKALQKIRQKYGFNEKHLILSARYSIVKKLFRLDLILQAFKIMLEKNSSLDSRLIFINNADKQQDLKQLAVDLGIADKVSFLGFLDNEAYSDVIRMVDLNVQCPFYDAGGVSLMESLAAGIPVISTHVTGAEINLIDDYNGLFLDSRDPEEIAQKMAKLLLDNELYKTLSKNAHEWAQNNCSKEKVMSVISKQFYQTLEKKS